MKTIKYLLAALLFGFFFTSCETESLEEMTADSAALVEFELQTKLTKTFDEDQNPQRSEDDDDMPDPEGKDPSEDDDDMPDPEGKIVNQNNAATPYFNGKDPSEDDDDMPDPEGKDPSEDDDDMPDPEGKDPSEDDDDMPDPEN
jgi:hypothetical protein